MRPGAATQAVGRVEHEDIVGIEHGIEHMAGLVFVHALQHRDPVGGIAVEMHEAFRTGDLGHRHGGVEGVAAGDAVGDFELVGAEADAVGAVGRACA